MDGNIRDEVKCKNNRSINQKKHNVSDVCESYTRKSMKTNVCSSSIATVVVRHLNITLNKKLSQQPLHVLFDSDSNASY